MRAVTIADKEIAVRSESDIGGNKINWPRGIGRIFARIAVRPDWLAIEGGLRDFAAVNVAVIEEFPFRLAAQAKPVGAAAKFLAERADEASIRVIHDDRLATHAGFVDRMSDIDVALLILRKAMRIAPDEAVGRSKPVVHAFIRVKSGTYHRQTLARFVRRLHGEMRNGSRYSQLRAIGEKGAARRGF